MKAAVYSEYGSPEVLTVKEVEMPTTKANEVLVRIISSAVNSGDVRLRKADPFAVRFMFGLTKPKINILGGVFSGRIEAIGDNVTRFKVGDEVFGSTDMKFGAYAEFKCFAENGSLSLKPKNVTHAEAAVIPFGGSTALYFLRKANVKRGQKVLIYGASGAVGTAAVQLAKYFGAEVTAVCGTGNVEMVKSLGADRVIDYMKEDCTITQEKYDVIYDTVNILSVSGAMKMLTKNGILLLGAAGLSEMMGGASRALFGSRKVVFGVTRQTAADIQFLAELVQSGKLKPVIDKSFSLEQIAMAHAYVDKGHKKGNVALMMS